MIDLSLLERHLKWVSRGYITDEVFKDITGMTKEKALALVAASK